MACKALVRIQLKSFSVWFFYEFRFFFGVFFLAKCLLSGQMQPINNILNKCCIYGFFISIYTPKNSKRSVIESATAARRGKARERIEAEKGKGRKRENFIFIRHKPTLIKMIENENFWALY